MVYEYALKLDGAESSVITPIPALILILGHVGQRDPT